MANEFKVKNGVITPNIQLPGATSGTLTIVSPAVAGTNTIVLPATTDTLVGKNTTDTLTNKTIAAASNTISGLTNTNLSGSAGITNANLDKSDITVGTTAIALGSSSTTLDGLTSVTSTSFIGELTGNASTATTLQNARTINGVSFDGSANIVVSTSTTNALTIGTGLSGTSFDGGSAVTIAIDSTVATLTGTQTLTGKTIDLASNTLTATSAQIAAAVTDETGSGALVFATSPTLVTPVLGVASATSINKLAITAPATGSTLAIADGKTFTVNNTITIAGTDATTITLPATTGTVALNDQVLYVGTTSIAINRASASQSLTGITSIDGSAATLTTARAIYGNNFDGSAALAQVIVSTYGGTGNQFTKFSGPTTAEKTFTLPDQNATLLYSGGALGTPSGGTLTNATGLPVSTGISGLGTGVATFLATSSSANLAAAVTDETGSGALVFGTSPAITTSLTTGSTSFDLINTTATTVNFAKAATTLSIGDTTGTTTVNNSLVVSGDLTVNGTTTTINATTITVDDKNIELGSVATPTNTTADGGGITLKGATDKTFNWINANAAWTSSENLNLVTTKTYKINGTDVLSATALGSAVVGSSLTSVGTIATGTWQGTVISSTYGGTGINNAGRTLSINTNSGSLAYTNASTTLTIANNASVSGTNTGDQTITLTGDVTGTGTGSFATTLASSGVTAGTYTKVTVDAKGRVTAGIETQTATISDTAPISPAVGNLWWDSSAGKMFIYYNDGISSQWVETSPSLIAPGVGGTFTFGSDLIVSGDLTVTGTLFETSDRRLKTNITTIESPLETVNKLRGVDFNWIVNGKKSMGMIAQEVEAVLPHLVVEQDDGTKTLHYTAIIGLLIEAVKELTEKINGN